MNRKRRREPAAAAASRETDEARRAMSPPMRHFFTSVAGESYHNADGSDRQVIIPSCRVGELLVLEHEPDNPHDINAIRVLRRSGEQIGYLLRELAGEVVSRTPKGWRYHAAISGVGRARGVGPYGVSLLVVVENADADDAAVSAYAEAVLAADGRPRRRRGAPRIRQHGAAESTASEPSRVWLVVFMLVAFAVVFLLVRSR